MADLSSITLPNGNTYNFKDTTARSNSGVTGVKGNSESSYRTGNVNLTADNIGAIPYNQILRTTNAFASDKTKQLYISKIDDAFYAADKRWNVYGDIDGTPLTASQVASLFNGSAEGGFNITEGKTCTITMDFTPTNYFPGYPYGDIIIQFYHVARPTSVSMRMYCDYAAHGVGWHDLTVVQRDDLGASTGNTWVGYNGFYRMKTLEITIVGDTTNGYNRTQPTMIEMHLSRPDPNRTPFLSKYGPETLYYNLTAPNFIGNLSGNATSANTANTANTASSANIATAVATQGNGTTDVYRHVWFSDSYTETKRAHDDDFTYNPASNTLKVANIDGKINGHTVNKDVPANAVFTDTTNLSSMTGTLGLDHGGTGATSAAAARTNLGLGSAALASTAASVGNNTNLPTGAAVQSYITGLGYLTPSSTLDATKLSGTVPTANLPSYVDDVLEYSAKSSFPATGETGKIYVDTSTNLTWRWSGSTYVEISPSLALGETSATAYRGDRGAAAYAHAVTNKGSAFSSNLYKITTNSEGHVTAASTVSKNDITSLGIPAQDTTYSNMSFEEASAGTSTTARSISAKILHDTIEEFITNPLGAYQTTVGDGTNTTYHINHGLNNEFIVVSVSITDNNITYMAPLASVASLGQIGYSLTITDANNISITFTSAPDSNAAKISVISTQAVAEAIDNLLLLTPDGEDYLKI